MLGLKESGEYEMMENMVKNFAYLIKQYGHIPNGNRTYYISRSQPPFFSLMVELLASVKGDRVYQDYKDELYKEFYYHTSHCFKFYCHYRDDLFIPRQESYYEDDSTARYAVLEFQKQVRFADSNRLKRAVDSIYALTCNNLRSAAASGWDFSSRWMSGEGLHTTKIRQIVPIDIMCLLFNLEKGTIIGNHSELLQDSLSLDGMRFTNTSNLKSSFQNLLRREFYNEKLGWYCDYSMDSSKPMNNPTLAGMYPLFFKLADEKEVPGIVDFLKKNFLKDGGVATSLKNTGQQWDAPNGWAPLQWITIIGLENYGYHELAKEIATRWVNLNKKVFNVTGKLMEKYDVVDTNKPAGGGEYPSQDGFGWTNGVLLALMNKYGF
jgi:alpha,alpha-trehalase